MKKTILAAIIGLLVVPVFALGVLSSSTAYACAEHTIDDETSTGTCRAMTAAELLKEGSGSIDKSDSCLFTSETCTDGIFTKIINTALFIIGALSVVMLIFGGIRYTISAGDAKQVEAAKSTIMYAVIGIIIALLAGAIVNFVLSSLM